MKKKKQKRFRYAWATDLDGRSMWILARLAHGYGFCLPFIKKSELRALLLQLGPQTLLKIRGVGKLQTNKILIWLGLPPLAWSDINLAIQLLIKNGYRVERP